MEAAKQAGAKKPPKRFERKEKKPPKKPTPTYFENVALWYLQRYASTTGALRKILQKRVTKAVAHYDDVDTAACAAWIEDTILKMQRLNYVNDETYRDSKVASLRRSGASKRKIEAKLAEKGLRVTLESDEEIELEAARAYVKRRRLGTYRTRAVENARDKDLAALARAGYSRSIAVKALAPFDD